MNIKIKSEGSQIKEDTVYEPPVQETVYEETYEIPVEEEVIEEVSESIPTPEVTDYTANEVINQSTMSIKDWVITLILLAIPVVNIIMIIVWLLGKDTPQVKRNFLIAEIIIILIAIVLTILLTVLGAGAIGTLMLGAMS